MTCFVVSIWAIRLREDASGAGKSRLNAEAGKRVSRQVFHSPKRGRNYGASFPASREGWGTRQLVKCLPFDLEMERWLFSPELDPRLVVANWVATIRLEE
jgi:hypothetical protein